MTQMYINEEKSKEIKDFLNTLLPEDWGTWSLDKRREFWKGDREGGCDQRRAVCSLEIWRELFEQDRKLTMGDARQINAFIATLPGWERRSVISCGSLYGRQRGFFHPGFLAEP